MLFRANFPGRLWVDMRIVLQDTILIVDNYLSRLQCVEKAEMQQKSLKYGAAF